MGKHQVIIVSLLKPMEIGTEFIMWPNHITLIPFFWTENYKKLVGEVREICKNTSPIEYEVGKIEFLGRRKNVKTNRVPSEEIVELQKKFYEIAVEHDKKFESSFFKNKFHPHITHNETPYPVRGKIGEINEIYTILHLYPNRRNKKVLDIIKLG